ncbi:MAG: LOW QUALITY PROTEIN: hypothetical protein J3Q66DRAFT_333933 [Benniella sp.]|nr:MAG: LOW QUALITY PROTEIN: hypothetical protein J3Q66DRAFT_333933 [Benniella sp.]
MSSRLMVKRSLFPLQPAGRSSNGLKPWFYTTTHHGWRPRSNSVFIKTGSKESITSTVKVRCTLNQQCPFLAGSGMKGCLGLRYSTTTPMAPAPLLRLDTPVHIRHFSQLSVSSFSSIPPSSSSGATTAVRQISPISPNGYVSVAQRSQRWSSSSASAVPHNIPSRSTSASTEISSELSSWNIPQLVRQGGGGRSSKSQSSRRRGPLPLPVQIKATRSQSNRTSSVVVKSSSSSSISHPPVIGSQPLFYLAKRFPLLAEQELNAMPHKTAFDYSCFILGATHTPHPSATTLRAVLRQFRNFLKDSLRRRRQGKTTTTTPIELPKARVWAQVIRGLIRLKQYRRARVALHTMQRLGIQPTGYTWRSICRGWIEQGELDRAEALAVKVFTDPNYSHYSGQEEEEEQQPSFFTSKHRPGRSSTVPSFITDFEAKRKRWSPVASHSAPLARYWYDRIPAREMTSVITSIMVEGYLKVKQRDKAQEVIRIMTGCGVKPKAVVFNPIVEHAAQTVSMEAAEDLVKDMVGIGVFVNLPIFKILIRGYIAAGQRSKALQCLDRIHASGLETDRALGRILLDALWGVGKVRKGDRGRQFQDEEDLGVEDLDFVGKPGWSQRCIEWIRSNHYEQAEEVIRQSLDLSNTTSDVEIVQVIKALADHQALPRARYWLDQWMSSSSDKVRYDNSVLVDLMNHVVARYIKVQQPKEAEAVMRVMSQRGVLPTVETANLIVQGSILNGEMVDAEAFVHRMVESGISLNQRTYEILCQGYALRGDTESLQECLTRMEKAGFGPSTWGPATGQLRSYLLGNHGADSEQSQSSSSSSSSSFNVLDTLCTQWIEQGHITRADRFVRQLLTNPNVPADKIPFASLIQGWIHQSQQNPVSSLATPTVTRSSKGSRSNPSQPTSSSVSSSKSLDHETRIQQESVAKMSKARSWFDKIPEGERTLELANGMIGGYMGLGLEGEADELIQWLALRKIKPDVVTHTVQRLSMPAAEGLVSRMQKGGLSPNIDTWNLLIRGYVIRGELREALRCLDRMAGRIPVTSESSKPKSRKSRTRAEIEIYDREIVDADEDEEYGADGVVVAERMKVSFGSVAPDETTEQLILSGFGAEPRIQGQGDSSDYTRALEVYRTRQQEMLFEGLATLRQQPQALGTRATLSPSSPSPLLSLEQEGGVDEKKKKEAEEEEQEAWILDHRVGALSDSDIGMTDVDWKNELKWEEMIEMERERERKLSGPRLDSLK